MKLSAVCFVLVGFLFSHNLIAGLLPVMSERSDYHAAKSAFVVDNAAANDVVLTSYEPILIFYLRYHCAAEVMNSGSRSVDEIEDRLGMLEGNAYAFSSFFEPMESMRHRDAGLYGRMAATGDYFVPEFVKIKNDEFGGMYRFNPEPEF